MTGIARRSIPVAIVAPIQLVLGLECAHPIRHRHHRGHGHPAPIVAQAVRKAA